MLQIGRRNYRFFKRNGLRFIHSFLFPENVNEVIAANVKTTEVDFMSIDIDGNDYEIWKAIDVVKPKLVVIENKIEYADFDIVVPASDQFKQSEWGASLKSVSDLGSKKGYTMVATNKEGFNAFFVRNDCIEMSGLGSLRVAEVLSNEQVRNSAYSSGVIASLQHRIGSLRHK